MQPLADETSREGLGLLVRNGTVFELRAYALKRDMLHRFAPGKRVLDFGCYDGGFLAYLGDDFDRWGIEPSDAAAERAKERGIHLLSSTLSGVDPATTPPFDAVIIFDVMEHLVEPVEILAKLGGLLKPGGIILIETGNTDAPGFKALGPRYLYAAIVEHVGFFNEASLREAGRRTGLNLRHFQKTCHTILPGFSPLKNRIVNIFYAALRTIRKMGAPMPAHWRNIADGPVPRAMDLNDHFLAILQKPL